MKKEYITPEIRVTELTEDMTILAGSDTGTIKGYDTGGVDGGSNSDDIDEDISSNAKRGSVWD